MTDNRSEADKQREINQSLKDAGIGLRYHSTRLESLGDHGKGLKRWMTDNKPALQSGLSAVFHGLGMTDLITTFARGLHINGIGVRVVPLSRMGSYIKSPEKVEELSDEVRALFIMNCADSRKGCPLYDRTMADVEWLIRERFDNKKSTFLHFSVDDQEKDIYKIGTFWSEEMLYFIKAHFKMLRYADLKGLAR